MADKSLFPRLKRMFSTDVVVRNVGGNQLKVIDTERIQSFGNLSTNNTMIDRFSRLYKAGNRMQYNPGMNYQMLRQQLYQEYDVMDTDGIVANILDIVCEESTLKGETNEVLKIRSTNENIQKILYNLFYDILNIEFNLSMWIRSMCKYGDLFLKMNIAEKYGITGAYPLSTYDMIREEGKDLNNPAYVRFIYDPISVTGGTLSTNKNKETFENFEIAHFRLLTDTNYLPYGRSYLEPARKYFKQYILMLDAMLLHRIMRAPEKRVFYVNVGNIPPNEVPAFMEKMVTEMKKTPFFDQQTGDYNLKFNVQNMLEDFYIPVRPGDTTTKIDTTKGLEYAGIEDVEFLRDLLLGSLKVPKAFLNYSDELNGKSTISALDLRFGRTIERIQRITVSELNKIALVHLYVQGYEDADLVNFELSLNSPSIIYEQEKIALLKEKAQLAADLSEKRIRSTDWIADKIWEMSDDELNKERDLIREDAKRKYRENQIETEGNDPMESGESYGTPHDLASIYNRNAKGDKNIPNEYDEDKNLPGPGRPKEKASIYTTDKSAFGRDPLGKEDAKRGDDGGKNKIKTRAMALENEVFKNKNLISNLDDKFKKKKLTIFEAKNEEADFLDERNIL